MSLCKKTCIFTIRREKMPQTIQQKIENIAKIKQEGSSRTHEMFYKDRTQEFEVFDVPIENLTWLCRESCGKAQEILKGFPENLFIFLFRQYMMILLSR